MTAGPAGDAAGFDAFELLPDAVVVVDADGEVSYVNEIAGRLLGRSGANVLGEPVEEALPLYDESGSSWWLLAPAADADPRLHTRVPEQDLLLDTRSGKRPVTLTAARVSRGGGTWTLLVLRRAERRRRLDAARSELVATVSHELRSPLTAVKGFTKTLLAKWDRFSDEQKQQMLETVNADADRVTRLLGELLDVSRIDAGRLQLHRRRVAIASLVERVVERVGAAGGAPSIEASVPDGLPDVYADEDKVEQVLTNFVENAITHGSGTVWVTGEAGNDHVRLTVSDEGGSIDAQNLRHVFAKFYRGNAEGTAGTGLGLYISKGIAEAHGGQVWAESDPDRGTHFHVRLPVGPMPELPARDGRPRTYADGGS